MGSSFLCAPPASSAPLSKNTPSPVRFLNGTRKVLFRSACAKSRSLARKSRGFGMTFALLCLKIILIRSESSAYAEDSRTPPLPIPQSAIQRHHALPRSLDSGPAKTAGPPLGMTHRDHISATNVLPVVSVPPPPPKLITENSLLITSLTSQRGSRSFCFVRRATFSAGRNNRRGRWHPLRAGR